jgi:nitrogen fixation protein NifU and related proteins
MSDDFEKKVQDAMKNPQNMGEMKGADAVGTAGSGDCGDMLRMWIKFREENGKKVIDRATFQSFGCETAIAVASLATELIRGKTADEALSISGQELAKDLGPLPPMKIHCTQLVEGALRSALQPSVKQELSPSSPPQAPTLMDSMTSGEKDAGKMKIVFKKSGG